MRRFFSSFKRSHLAGQSPGLVGEEVQLSGWLQTVRRMKGGTCFGLLRDHSGVVQLNASTPEIAAELGELPLESCLSVVGTVVERPAQAVNKKMSTGRVELDLKSLAFTSANVMPLPFSPEDSTVNEELRLRHRPLELRSSRLQHNLRVRAEVWRFSIFFSLFFLCASFVSV